MRGFGVDDYVSDLSMADRALSNARVLFHIAVNNEKIGKILSEAWQHFTENSVPYYKLFKEILKALEEDTVRPQPFVEELKNQSNYFFSEIANMAIYNFHLYERLKGAKR